MDLATKRTVNRRLRSFWSPALDLRGEERNDCSAINGLLFVCLFSRVAKLKIRGAIQGSSKSHSPPKFITLP